MPYHYHSMTTRWAQSELYHDVRMLHWQLRAESGLTHTYSGVYSKALVPEYHAQAMLMTASCFVTLSQTCASGGDPSWTN